MDKTELDKEKLNNLKEYSNELQNSIVKVDIIREFRNVFIYWQRLKKCKNISNIFKEIELMLNEKNSSFIYHYSHRNHIPY